jgi:hypothetical protein
MLLHLAVSLLLIACHPFNRCSVQGEQFPCDINANCGCSQYAANINARIVGGEIAAPHSWGWAVMLNYFGLNVCGGSILSEYYIITAAHCVDDIPLLPQDYSVIVGTDTRVKSDGQRRDVETIILHPQYNPKSKANDIAILRLATPINFSDPHVAKICLPLIIPAERPNYPIVELPIVSIIHQSRLSYA